MAIGRPVEPVNLSPTVRQEIILITKSRTMPYALVQRAKIVLLAAEGLSNTVRGTLKHCHS